MCTNKYYIVNGNNKCSMLSIKIVCRPVISELKGMLTGGWHKYRVLIIRKNNAVIVLHNKYHMLFFMYRLITESTIPSLVAGKMSFCVFSFCKCMTGAGFAPTLLPDNELSPTKSFTLYMIIIIL